MPGARSCATGARSCKARNCHFSANRVGWDRRARRSCEGAGFPVATAESKKGLDIPNVRRAPQVAWLDVLARILRDRDYRAVAVALLALGLSDGVITPYIAIWITGQLHGTTWQAAFIFVPYGLLSVVAGSLTSAYTDRVARRKGVILAALLANGAAVTGLAFAPSYPIAVVLYAVMALEPFAILFALLRDILLRQGDERGESGGSGAFITTLIRTVYSLGWLIGPALGGLLLGPLGYRGLFLISACLILSTVLWASRQIIEPPVERSTAVGRARSGRSHVREVGRPPRSPLAPREVILLGALFLMGLLLFSGDTGRLTFLSLYVTEDLHLPISDVSWAFSVAVLAELVFLPLAGRLADRFGVAGILSLGIVAQAIYFFGMGWTASYWVILLLQVLYAFVIAASQGVAILFAQRSLASGRTGLTTSTYLVSRGPAPLLNSLLIATSLIGARLDRLFDLFGLFACGALALVLLLSRHQPQSAG